MPRLKEKLITVIIKEPGKEPVVDHFFENTLEAFQEAVGGYIETVTFATDAVIVCNEEGLLLNLPENRTKLGTLLGTIVVCGVKRDEFCSLKPNALKFLLEQMRGIHA